RWWRLLRLFEVGSRRWHRNLWPGPNNPARLLPRRWGACSAMIRHRYALATRAPPLMNHDRLWQADVECVLTTVFLDVFGEVRTRFEALFVGLARHFTKPVKFIRWDDTSRGLCHRTDTR